MQNNPAAYRVRPPAGRPGHVGCFFENSGLKQFLYLQFFYKGSILSERKEKQEYFPASSRSCLKAVIFSANRSQTDQVKTNLLHITGEVYPAGLCLSILPDASLRVCSGFLVGPVSGRWRRSAFLSEVD